METNIKKNIIKPYNLQQYLTKGTYLDIKDSSSKEQDAPWRVAKIIEREDKYLTIRFDAWQPKYDEQIHILSSKIAPFRKYSEGYTGPQRKTIRDSPLRLDNLNQHKIKMERMASLQQQSFSPHEINQYLRGELLIQIDSFLTFSCQLETEEVKLIVAHLKQVIEFVIKFCDKCLVLAVDNFQEFLNIKDSYLLNEKWAYIAALQEVLYYLILIFLIKGENRNKLYTMMHKKLDWNAIFPVQQYGSIVEYFKSIFIKNRGLDKIKKIFLFKQINGRGFYSTIRKSCLLIANICNYKLPFPSLQPKDYIQTYKLIPIYLEFYQKEETEVAILEYSINLGIGNNSFESKLKGINQFKINLQKIKTRSNNNLFKIVTEQKLLDILKSSNFMEIMIDGKNFNSEIFKRSMPIIKFIGQKKGLQPKQIQSIFKLAENRHESQTILIYGVLAQLACFGAVDILDFTFTQILKLKFNEFTINLMKQFTIKAIENLSKQNSFFGFLKRRKNSSKYDYYALNILWKEIQDEGKLQMKYFGITMDALKYIFSSDSFKSVRQTYLIDCLQNIKKKKNFGQAMRLFLNILLCYNVSTYLGDNRGDMVAKLDKKYQIIEISTNGLKKYQYQKVPYNQSLEYFFEFLEEYNGNLRVPLKIDNIKNLWKLDNNISSLLNFLRKTKISEEKQVKKKYIKRIPNELIKDLFQNIFLQASMMNNFQIPQNVYDTVDQLFITLNLNAKNLEINDKQTIRLLNVPLIGTQFYQNVLLNCNNKINLLNKAKKRYVQLNIRLKDHNDIQKKLGIWMKFFDRLLLLLIRQPKHKDCVIPILHQFLRQIQGKMVRQNVFNTGLVQIIVKAEDHIKAIKLSKNSTIFKLRKLIMSQFDIQNDFVMEAIESNKDIQFIEEEDYSVNAIQLANKGPSIRIYLKKVKHPHLTVLQLLKQKISYKPEVFQTLINLMSENSNNQQIWDILDLLPKNRNLLDKLQFIDNQYDNHKWKEFFNQKNYKKLHYKLRLLGDLIKKQIWIKNFKKTGGFIQLINKTISIPQKDFKVSQNIKPISYLCKMIFICFDNYQESDNQINKQQICKKLIEYIKLSFELQSVGPFINNTIKLYLKLLQSASANISLLLSDLQFINNLIIVGVLKFPSKSSNDFILTFIQIFTIYIPTDDKIQVTMILIKKLLSYERLSKFKDCEYYFILLLKCLQELSQQEYLKLITKDTINIEMIINKFTEEIFVSKQKQVHQKDFNSLIYGALRLKSFLLKKNSIQNQSLEKLVILLVGEYLFHQNQLSTSRVKSIKNIHQLYHLLSILFSMNQSFIKILTSIIVPRLQHGQWRKLSYMDWLIEADHEERKLYCGLKNLRAICYINCLLQQFYMIQPFRQAILQIDSEYYNKDVRLNEIFQLQKLFTFLKMSSKGSYNPREFCDALKIDVGIQSDVDEFFNSFMQKLQNFLKVEGKTEIVDNCFKGTLSNQLICEGKHQIQREQSFLSLGVTIKNKNSLEQALKSYIEGQILDGQNAYYCQKCEKKVRTLKRVCVKDLPNVLIIVLKRFQFNYDTMKKIKINDYCSFPTDLDLKKITNQYLKEKDEDRKFMDDNYYQFKLRGVVVHYGSSEAGHYYSYIKNQKDWFEFNDQNISNFNFNELAEQTFGGTQAFGNQDSDTIKTQKCKNAYLLFYERSSFYNKNRQKTSSMVNIMTEAKQKYNRLNQLVIRDNSNFEFVNILFEPEFAKFIINLNVTPTSIQTIKLMFIYFHTVILRNRQKEDYIVVLGSKLENFLKNQIAIAQWYINQINRNFIREFTIDAPKLLKYIIVGFIKVALSTLPVLPPNFIKILVSCLERKGMTPFAKLFYDISKRPEGKQQLEKLFYAQRAIAYLISDSSVKCQDIVIDNQPISEFGGLKQKKQKERQFDTIALTQSLQNFKISYENLQIILQKTNCKSSRKSIARMAMHHMNTLQEIEIRLTSICQKIIQGDERDIKNYMYWFKELLNKKDINIVALMQLIIKKHLELFEPYQNTYYPFEILLKYLFKFAFKYHQYKIELLAQFDQNPKYYKTIENWIDLSGIATKKVYNQEWTVYKKKLAGSLPQTSAYYQDKRQFRLKQLQKIMAKTTSQQTSNDIIDSDQQITNRDLEIKKQDMFIKIGLKNISRVSVMNRIGLLYQISVEGNMRWYIGDKDEVDFYNSII